MAATDTIRRPYTALCNIPAGSETTKQLDAFFGPYQKRAEIALNNFLNLYGSISPGWKALQNLSDVDKFRYCVRNWFSVENASNAPSSISQEEVVQRTEQYWGKPLSQEQQNLLQDFVLGALSEKSAIVDRHLNDLPLTEDQKEAIFEYLVALKCLSVEKNVDGTAAGQAVRTVFVNNFGKSVDQKGDLTGHINVLRYVYNKLNSISSFSYEDVIQYYADAVGYSPNLSPEAFKTAALFPIGRTPTYYNILFKNGTFKTGPVGDKDKERMLDTMKTRIQDADKGDVKRSKISADYYSALEDFLIHSLGLTRKVNKNGKTNDSREYVASVSAAALERIHSTKSNLDNRWNGRTQIRQEIEKQLADTELRYAHNLVVDHIENVKNKREYEKYTINRNATNGYEDYFELRKDNSHEQALAELQERDYRFSEPELFDLFYQHNISPDVVRKAVDIQVQLQNYYERNKLGYIRHINDQSPAYPNFGNSQMEVKFHNLRISNSVTLELLVDNNQTFVTEVKIQDKRFKKEILDLCDNTKPACVRKDKFARKDAGRLVNDPVPGKKGIGVKLMRRDTWNQSGESRYYLVLCCTLAAPPIATDVEYYVGYDHGLTSPTISLVKKTKQQNGTFPIFKRNGQGEVLETLAFGQKIKAETLSSALMSRSNVIVEQLNDTCVNVDILGKEITEYDAANKVMAVDEDAKLLNIDATFYQNMYRFVSWAKRFVKSVESVDVANSVLQQTLSILVLNKDSGERSLVHGSLSFNRIRCFEKLRSVVRVVIDRTEDEARKLELEEQWNKLNTKYANIVKERENKLLSAVMQFVHDVQMNYGPCELVLEDISKTKTSSKTSRKSNRIKRFWRGVSMKNKIVEGAKRLGVNTLLINPAFTSHTDVDGEFILRESVLTEDNVDQFAKEYKADLHKNQGKINVMYQAEIRRRLGIGEDQDLTVKDVKGLLQTSLKKAQVFQSNPEDNIWPRKGGNLIFSKHFGRIPADEMASYIIARHGIYVGCFRKKQNASGEVGTKTQGATRICDNSFDNKGLTPILPLQKIEYTVKINGSENTSRKTGRKPLQA